MNDDFDEFGFCYLCFASKEMAQLVRLHWTPAQPSLRSRMVIARPLTNDDFCLCMDCIRGIKRLPFSHLPEPVPHKPADDNDVPF